MILSPKKRYSFKKLEWTLNTLRPYLYGESQNRTELTAIQESKKILSEKEKKENRFRIRTKAGKITDAGYDQMQALYTAIPGDRDFVFKARLQVLTFLHEGVPTGQEGFGVFLRDTMSPDPKTGMYYSNMAAIGAYHSCFNFFGRCGITNDSFENVLNFALNRGDADHSSAAIPEDDPLELSLTLRRKGKKLSARIVDQNGIDKLSAGRNQTLSGDGIPILKEKKTYVIDLPPGTFEQREADLQYIGFFSARGADIQIDTKSVRLHVERKHTGADDIITDTSEMEKIEPENISSSADHNLPSFEPEFSERSVLYVSPKGRMDSAGTLKDPMDLMTAVSDCPAGGEIRLLPGCYMPDQSIVLGDVPRDKAGGDARGLFRVNGIGSRCVRLIAASGISDGKEMRPQVIIDFQGSKNCLMITGNHRKVAGVAVTGGYGIWLTGNCNTVSRCHAFKNRETGILIRALRNDTPTEHWPAGNQIVDCLSYENCDMTGQNADGFACKVAAGKNNRFERCKAYLNTDDGFDLFSKNRKIGAVILEDCESFLNGWLPDEEEKLAPSKGNGNGFKLGGSGLAVRHKAVDCRAKGNRADGFTSNSNPVMILHGCSAEDNGGRNINYYYTGPEAVPEKTVEECTQNTDDAFDAQTFYEELRDSFL